MKVEKIDGIMLKYAFSGRRYMLDMINRGIRSEYFAPGADAVFRILFEIFTDSLPAQQKNARKAFTANDLPVVERDFAFLADKNLAVGELIKTIASTDKQLIKEVSIFDIFSGNNIAEDKKSVALRVKIQPQEKTLTSEEIEVISKKIIDAVAKTGTSLRV